MELGVSLLTYNTFGIDEPADQLLVIADMNQLAAAGALPVPRKVLGGGSNVLLTGPVQGVVLLNRLKGRRVVRETEEHVWLEAASGENWHELVCFALDHDWAGIENLSLIPGTVGASPMQNIGAYGVEVRNVIEQVTAWHWARQELVQFSNAECRFGYRDSIFKHALKEQVFITSVTYKLSKKPVFQTSYGAIQQELERMGIRELSIRAIADAVTAIRRSKLPDPKVTGNAGSFFKNPTIPQQQFEALSAAHPGMPGYAAGPALVKVPAGWLIEQCGWKGYRRADAGVHPLQALVLVNYGGAKGHDIWQLSKDILQSVQERFGISLEREVQVW
jgi:UDP-N-acetylmuramate dehydrogenase